MQGSIMQGSIMQGSIMQGSTIRGSIMQGRYAGRGVMAGGVDGARLRQFVRGRHTRI